MQAQGGPAGMTAQQAAMQRARAEQQQGRPGMPQHPGQPQNAEQHDNMMMYQQHHQMQQQQMQAQQQAMLRAQSNSSPMMQHGMPQGQRPGSPGMHMQHIGPHGELLTS